ncbi:MAG: exopolysaccharide Pel transporter PelG [Ruminococcaceae bacterium]|nr:exopolysaccharide Pel transporter PelG [Oscillospiraceae bacterium]
MAGIGFELKKIFRNQTVISRIQGYSYAAMVSAGPMLISISMLITQRQLLRLADISIHDRELISATIMYAFIFALILVSGPSIIATRFIADKTYIGRKKGILSSLLGMTALTVIIGAVAGFLFLRGSPLPFSQKITAYLLFIELIILYLLMVYVTAVKNYKAVSLAFASGFGLSLLPVILLLFVKLPPVETTIAGINLGFMVSIALLLGVIKSHFHSLNEEVFAFGRYFYRLPRLFGANFFYNLALFAHNIIFWLFSSNPVRLENTYTFLQPYDMASFFAVLTVLPAMVLFVIKIETAFYEKYIFYTKAISEGSTFQRIRQARDEMLQVLNRDLTNIFEVQFIVSVIIVALGTKILLPLLGMDSQTIELFPILCLGFYLSSMTFIIVTILLYFDAQTESFRIMGLLLTATSALTILLLPFGENFYGLGFAVGTFAAMLYAIRCLSVLMNQIDFHLFSRREDT